MENNKFDKKIRAKLVDKYSEIPENIENVINNTLNSLEKRNRKPNYLKIVAMIAITLVGISIVGVTATAISVGIPIKDVIYELTGFAPKYQDYASDINVTKEDMGIKYTITSAVFDGYKLSLAYIVESDRKDILDSPDLYPIISTNDVTINGNKVVMSGTEASGYINENTIAGVATFDIEGSNVMGGLFGVRKIDVVDTFNIEFKINKEINGDKVSLEFSIPISSEKIKKEVREYKVNKDIGSGKITKVIVTPLSIYVDGEFKSTDNKVATKEAPGYILIDSNGVAIKSTEASISSKGNNGTFRYEFVNKYENIDSIKLIPYKERDISTEKFLNKVNREIKLELSDSGFSANNTDELQIVNVVREENQTKIYYKTKYPMICQLWILANEDGVSNLVSKGNEQLEKNIGILTVEGRLENRSYNFQYNSVEESLEIFEGKEVTVSLE